MNETRMVSQPVLNIKQIAETNILVPLCLQQHFATLIDDAERLPQKQQQSERELEQLFGALLQTYFGEQSIVHLKEQPLSIAAEPESIHQRKQ